MRFPGKDFFSKCDEIRICSKLTIKTPVRRHWHRSGVFIVNFEHMRIWSHLLKKSFMENFIFCALMQIYATKLLRRFPMLSLSRSTIKRYFYYYHYNFISSSFTILQFIYLMIGLTYTS